MNAAPYLLYGTAIGLIIGYLSGLHTTNISPAGFKAWLQAGGQEFPAWVQAVGAIIGIAVAIFVPWWQHREIESERKQEMRLRARSMAYAIFPSFAVLEITAKRVLGKFEILEQTRGTNSPTNFSIFSDAVKRTDEIINYISKITVSECTIEIPPPLIKCIDNIYLLNKSGEHIQDLVSVIGTYNRMIKLAFSDGPLNLEQAKSIKNLVDEISIKIQGCIKELRQVLPDYDYENRRSY